MPQIFRIGSYTVYFWSNEGNPLEPVHVHIAEGRPYQNATKVWITKTGHAFLCNNNSKIPTKILRGILRMIEANSTKIIEQWTEQFNDRTFFC